MKPRVGGVAVNKPKGAASGVTHTTRQAIARTACSRAELDAMIAGDFEAAMLIRRAGARLERRKPR